MGADDVVACKSGEYTVGDLLLVPALCEDVFML